MNDFEKILEEKMNLILGEKDPAHDIFHVKRVVNIAKKISLIENGNLNIVIPAAWLHDFVNLEKSDPNRSKASYLSAVEGIKFLESIHYPADDFENIFHAIEAHSFSANITPKTLEAKIVQDADRLDGLGAIGIYRLFAVSTRMNKNLKDAIFHVEEKLRPVSKSMQTDFGKKMAQERMQFIDSYLQQLSREIN